MKDLTQICESAPHGEKQPDKGAASSSGNARVPAVETRAGKNKPPKRVGYLCEKIDSEENVAAAVRDYCKGQRSERKRKRALWFWKHHGKALCEALQSGAWEPSPLRRFEHRDEALFEEDGAKLFELLGLHFGDEKLLSRAQIRRRKF